ncbi:hypothetical protein [uncultured Cohaesibacter sp.]|uniref:hypothetical protein n=1 Tax=uncultured Cohaesibacter sp. TaxID=1002546 RepID=UPI0029C7CE8B|nr:hypothetical protein [uncultured Cohaesibacter sp.]
MVGSHGDMSIERFEELLDRYGADLENWPQDEASAARELMLGSDLARKKFQFVLSIIKLAGSAPAPKAPASLVDRIMSKVKK